MHESADKAVLTWGKYTGLTLGSVLRENKQYIMWMSRTPLPNNWQEAAKLVLDGKDISHLSLPTAKTSSVPLKSVNKSPIMHVSLMNKNTACLVMDYDKLMLDKFKYEIDGRKWNGDNKTWEFPVAQLSRFVSVFPNAKLSPEAQQALEALVKRREGLDAVRDKDDMTIDIPGLKVPLYGYQAAGVRFIDIAGGRCLVADAPGLGKTAQAIAYAQLKNLKTIVICPLSVVINWQREIKFFTGKPSTIWDTSGHSGSLKNQFHITHYNAAVKNFQWLREQKFDLLVCDEATYLKNRTTIRAKSILGSGKEKRRFPGIKTKHSVFLTGTPVLSRPSEAFSLLNFLDSGRFNNFYHFVQRYGGWKGEPPTNLKDLHDRTKDLVIRRTKEQVLPDLPVKQRNDLYVGLTPEETTKYNSLLRELFGVWKSSGKPSVRHMPKIQKFLIERKLPRAIEAIDELLDNDTPMIIFSCYLDPLRRLQEHYGNKAVTLDGSMNQAQRQDVVDKLVDGTAKIGLFSLHAAGMGINGLQNAIHTVFFLDQDWVPANHEQGEDRAHRHGQTSQVQIYYMICADTIDEYMRDILREKQEVADVIVDGKISIGDRNKSFFKEFVRKTRSSMNEDFSVETIDD